MKKYDKIRWIFEIGGKWNIIKLQAVYNVQMTISKSVHLADRLIQGIYQV